MKIKLSTPLSSHELDALFGGCAHSNDRRLYTHVATHSDECDSSTLFFALDGEHVSADRFIPPLCARGVTCVGRSTSQGCYPVSSGIEALLWLAAYYKKTHLPSVHTTVGITGSVGKTTTKDAVAIMLAERYRVHKTPGNRNSEIGLPLSVLESPADAEILVLEMGINHKGEMMRLSQCASVDIGIITNIGTAHIGNFGSREEIAIEKRRIVLSDDIPIFTDATEPLLCDLSVAIPVGYGGQHQLIGVGEQDETMLYCSPHTELPLPYRMPPKDIASALLFALCVGERLGLSELQMLTGAQRILAACGRRQHYRIGDISIIDDSYNASLESIRLSLSVLCEREGFKAAVLSDMLELGEHSEAMHEELGRIIAAFKLARVYYLGDMAEAVRRGASAYGYDVQRIVDFSPDGYEACTAQILSDMKAGGHLLLKGSHKSALFRIREMLYDKRPSKEEKS